MLLAVGLIIKFLISHHLWTPSRNKSISRI